MPRLTHSDFARLSKYLEELYAFRDRSAFLRHMLATLPSLIPCERTSYNEMDTGQGKVDYLWEPDDPEFREKMRPVIKQYVHQHPTATFVQKTGQLQAIKITDRMSQKQFRRLALYNEYYRLLGVNYQMAVTLSATPFRIIPIALNRERRDFTEEDRLVLDLLRPHLALAHRNALAVAELHAELRALDEVVGKLDRGIIAMTPELRIGWATAHAHQLLGLYWANGSRRVNLLPETLREWVKTQEARLKDSSRVPVPQEPLAMERGERRLLVRFLRKEDQRLLILEEHVDQIPLPILIQVGLTRREAEIVAWIARGKSNAEAGTILGISPRTVTKHLERAYRALGVETRTAAATRALELSKELHL